MRIMLMKRMLCCYIINEEIYYETFGLLVGYMVWSELQVLSFIFRPFCKFCPLCLNLTRFVLYV
ncbi:hypothetical protein Hanom_Chr05g00465451 [Helianthus anomalus]